MRTETQRAGQAQVNERGHGTPAALQHTHVACVQVGVDVAVDHHALQGPTHLYEHHCGVMQRHATAVEVLVHRLACKVD